MGWIDHGIVPFCCDDRIELLGCFDIPVQPQASLFKGDDRQHPALLVNGVYNEPSPFAPPQDHPGGLRGDFYSGSHHHLPFFIA